MKTANELSPIVLIVDDDPSVREALVTLFRSVGIKAEVFGSASEFLQGKIPDGPRCLILDVRLPGLSGLDFQTELARSGLQIPIIFLTGHGDIPMSVKAMKAGAVEFLTKPFRDQDMLDAVGVAIEKDRQYREEEKRITDLRSRLESLTPREREVMALVTAGRMNKQIAHEIAVSEITVKVHRAKVMHKMGAQSLAELVLMADALGVRQKT